MTIYLSTLLISNKKNLVSKFYLKIQLFYFDEWVGM